MGVGSGARLRLWYGKASSLLMPALLDGSPTRGRQGESCKHCRTSSLTQGTTLGRLSLPMRHLSLCPSFRWSTSPLGIVVPTAHRTPLGERGLAPLKCTRPATAGVDSSTLVSCAFGSDGIGGWPVVFLLFQTHSQCCYSVEWYGGEALYAPVVLLNLVAVSLLRRELPYGRTSGRALPPGCGHGRYSD